MERLMLQTEIVNIDLMSGFILSLGDCLGYNFDSGISLDNVTGGEGQGERVNIMCLWLCGWNKVKNIMVTQFHMFCCYPHLKQMDGYL